MGFKLDLSKNEPLKDTPGVTLHPPTKFGEDRPKDLGGPFEEGGSNLTFQKMNPSRTSLAATSTLPPSLVKIGPETWEK